jgi:hypothetical protein
MEATCSDRQKWLMDNGKGVVISGVLYNKESDWQAPKVSVDSRAGKMGTSRAGERPSETKSGEGSPTSEATGVYVATAPPRSTESKKGGGAEGSRPMMWWVVGGAMMAGMMVGAG